MAAERTRLACGGRHINRGRRVADATPSAAAKAYAKHHGIGRFHSSEGDMAKFLRYLLISTLVCGAALVAYPAAADLPEHSF